MLNIMGILLFGVYQHSHGTIFTPILNKHFFCCLLLQHNLAVTMNPPSVHLSLQDGGTLMLWFMNVERS